MKVQHPSDDELSDPYSLSRSAKIEDVTLQFDADDDLLLNDLEPLQPENEHLIHF